jgi:hypothetical protein
MIRQGLAIAENRFFLFEPKARAVQSERRKVTRVDITDRQESESRASSPVDQQEQIISSINVIEVLKWKSTSQSMSVSRH